MAAVHQHFGVNTKGRDFVVGDLHGMYGALQKKLKKKKFDPGKDRLFSVGDLIDRGPDSPKCLKLLDEPWFFAVLGNHEDLMLNAVFGDGKPLWEFNGGEWAEDLSRKKLQKMAKRVQAMPIAMTIDLPGGKRAGITHAQFPFRNWKKAMAGDFGKRNRKAMIWGRSVINKRKKQSVKNVDLTVHGHTPLRKPIRLGSALFIDTGCVHGGKLTVKNLARAVTA